MALLEINRKIGKRQLRQFAMVWLVLWGLIGWMVYRHTHAIQVPRILWIAAAVSGAFGLLLPRFMRGLYLGTIYLVYPIGWVISHLILGFVFYVVLTLIGLMMKVFGHDPMERKFDRAAGSYWTAYSPEGKVERYFRQF